MHAYCLPCLLRWAHFKPTCPLCNSHFHSYFSSSSISSPSFRLLSLSSSSSSPPPPHPRNHRRRDTHVVNNDVVQSLLRRKREELNAVNMKRSRPMPRRRSFGRRGSVPSEVIAENIMQWRASVYKHGLAAVPFLSGHHHNLNISLSRERILSRIEPWIRRELQAILEDPDPTIIVHVATSLYLSRIEKRTRVLSTSADDIDSFLAPLQPFLHEWTDMFWHELRCFAESSFTMDIYDEVVEYQERK